MPSYITGFRADLDRGYLTLIHAPPVVRLSISVVNSTLVEGTTPMAITITDTQRFTATVSAVDAKGNPALLDSIVWAVSDPALLLLSVDPAFPALADVSAVGPLGVGQLTIVADADLTDGVRELSGVLDVTVISSTAVALAITTSAPVEQ